MATWAKLELTGLEAYLEEIEKAGHNIDGAARDAVYEGAVTLQEKMQSFVPILTGRLFMHILIKGPITEGNFSYCEVGVLHDIAFTPKDVAIQANVIEYGSTRQSAQPFIRPALRSKKIVIDAMKAILEKYGLQQKL